ncbi:3-oxoacyl-reductase 4 [Cladorrhinum samala]|uniref:3-oxoacyl-reductase 4 n=1 Tax=Cladorrhinum samala TaxID=585594 RepID=A0AAV9I0Q0_9PEZI|nr:3-oxoacyl-reductase 4 [Cladorrhinum samala]
MDHLKVDSYWRNFLSTQKPETIARQLLKDAARLDEGAWPSHLALHVPDRKQRAALEIANYLTPSRDLPDSLKRFLYHKIVQRLRNSIRDGGIFQERPPPKDGHLLAGDYEAMVVSPVRSGNRGLPAQADRIIPPTARQVDDALQVLKFVKSSGTISKQSLAEVDRVMELVRERCRNEDERAEPEVQDEEFLLDSSELSTLSWPEIVSRYRIHRPHVRARVCYVCGFLLTAPHRLYRNMCLPCGAFNYAGSAISMPKSLKLPNKTALVTGARINLGYLTALRLLRCGAKVIATSRYPHDAVMRYSREPDFEEWRHRLKVVGADFRLAQHAFAVARAVKDILAQWGNTHLDILINNAAQTIVESVGEEKQAVSEDERQRLEASTMKLNLVHDVEGYQPRVRGGLPPLALYGGPGSHQEKLHTATSTSLLQPDTDTSLNGTAPTSSADEVTETALSLSEPYTKSSWIQTLSEIPYEDVVSAHAINALAPLILCRELLPVMGDPRPKPAPQAKKIKPLGYILNVSSREGLFETSPMHPRKCGTKVHNNMNKAALNMITQTEAGVAWKTRRVAMNSIDPGYLSHAPEMDAHHGGELPLDWEDGAGRVLWPVAIGEVDGDAVWGRFLKHYGAADEDWMNVNR